MLVLPAQEVDAVKPVAPEQRSWSASYELQYPVVSSAAKLSKTDIFLVHRYADVLATVVTELFSLNTWLAIFSVYPTHSGSAEHRSCAQASSHVAGR